MVVARHVCPDSQATPSAQGTLRDCMQHMRSQYWAAAQPQIIPTIDSITPPAQGETDQSEESVDAHFISSSPLSTDAKPASVLLVTQHRILRRSSRLQQNKILSDAREVAADADGPQSKHDVTATTSESASSPSVRSSATHAFVDSRTRRGAAAVSPSHDSNKQRSQSVCWPLGT